jgi:exonuclease III
MNETKIDQEKFDAEVDLTYFPTNYYKFWNFCKPPLKGYSGVSIFTKTKPIKVYKDLGKYELD